MSKKNFNIHFSLENTTQAEVDKFIEACTEWVEQELPAHVFIAGGVTDVEDNDGTQEDIA